MGGWGSSLYSTGRDQAGVKITAGHIKWFGDEREMRASMSEIVYSGLNIHLTALRTQPDSWWRWCPEIIVTATNHPDPKLREQIHMICLSVNCLFNIYDEASKRSFYFYYTLIVKQAHWILRCVVPLLLQSELKKITMGDKDTLICKVGKMCHLNSKATLKEERSSSQNCHSIRPFTPLIFMCWENKIQGDSVILLL